MEVFSHMLWPLLACFVLVGIHAYLGIHVIARKVIFVDLALAQIAALGAVYGAFLGLSLEGNPWWIKLSSVAFTFIGAIVFSSTRTSDEKIPHEAIIGIIYAAALSLTILMTANLPHGADEVRQLLSGNILWVTPSEVIFTALLYSTVGLIHFLFRKQFFLLSDEKQLKSSNLNVRLWDFLFYMTFGIVVTSSVSVGGVLLVFAYLVIPSVIGIMLATSTKMRLLIGWSCGVFMSLLGVILSYFFELPSGPTIVVLLGLLLLLIALLKELTKRASRKVGVFHLFSLLLLGLLLIRLPSFVHTFLVTEHHHEDMNLEAGLLEEDETLVIGALDTIKEKKVTYLFSAVVPLLSSSSDLIRSHGIQTLAALDVKKASSHLKKLLPSEQDQFLKIEMAQVIALSGDKEGLFILEEIMKKAKDAAREDAFMYLKEWLLGAPLEQQKLFDWLQRNRDKLKFNETSKKYYIDAG